MHHYGFKYVKVHFSSKVKLLLHYMCIEIYVCLEKLPLCNLFIETNVCFYLYTKPGLCNEKIVQELPQRRMGLCGSIACVSTHIG